MGTGWVGRSVKLLPISSKSSNEVSKSFLTSPLSLHDVTRKSTTTVDRSSRASKQLAPQVLLGSSRLITQSKQHHTFSFSCLYEHETNSSSREKKKLKRPTTKTLQAPSSRTRNDDFSLTQKAGESRRKAESS